MAPIPDKALYFSDIDLVVVGLWDVLPLKTLERILLENKIVDPPMLKVIHPY